MKYEITYLVESEEQSKATLDLITSTGSTYTVSKEWGKRRLAYQIGKHKDAYYYTGIIQALPAHIADIKQKLNFAQCTIRYIIIKQDE